MNEIQITLETVRMFKRIMRPIAEEGIVPLPEYHEAISQLTSLAEHGRLKPVIVPKLIDQKEAAEMLAKENIAVRGGLHCAYKAHKKLGTLKTGGVRISIGRGNTMVHAQALIDTLARKMTC